MVIISDVKAVERYAKTPIQQSEININKIYALFATISLNPEWYKKEAEKSIVFNYKEIDES